MKDVLKSKSKKLKFEEYHNCLYGKEYRKECDNFLVRSINHDMFLQLVCKNTLSPFESMKVILKVNRGIDSIISPNFII